MARTGRIKTDGDACYHLMSRTNNKRFLFEKGSIKTELVSVLRRTAEFCGMTLCAYTMMSNHFHVLVKVTKPDEPIDTDELLRRVGVLKGEQARQKLSERWSGLFAAGFETTLKDEQNRFRARMNDISEFMKLFKEEFDRIYKRDQPYCGSIWAGRFTSTLVQDGEYFERCKRYIIYNPVRAGIVTQTKDYCWSWFENESKEETFSGFVPTEWWMKRVVQIGAGKVFGSVEFVMKMAYSLGDKFHAGAGAHPVGDIGHATHGWRLAKTAA